MIDQKELEKLGSNISKDYIQKNISLNDGLKKVASTHGLNKQQLRRVAENANVETYLTLIKTAKDKYLKFDLAKADDVHSDLVKKGTVVESTVLDYELPGKEIEASEIFELYKKAEISLYDEKMTEELLNYRNSIKNSTGEFKKQSVYLQGIVEYLNDKYMTTQANFNNDLEHLQDMVKQALLANTTFKDISNVVKKAAEVTSEAQLELFKARLANSMPHIDFEKEAQFSSSVPNKESEIYKLASSLDNKFLYLMRLEEAYDTYRGEYDKLRKENEAPNMLKNAGFFNLASSSFRWFREHPKTTAAMGMLASFKAGKMMAQKKVERRVPLTREAINLRLKQYKVR